MNILFITSGNLAPNRGGVDRVMALLKRGFEARNHHVYVIAKDKPLYDDIVLPGVYTLPVLGNVFAPENRTFAADLLNSKNIEIVVNHAPHLTMLELIADVLKNLQKNIPVISVWHTAPNPVMHNLIDSIVGDLYISEPLLRFKALLKDFSHFLYRVYNRSKYQRLKLHRTAELSSCIVLLSKKFKDGYRRFACLDDKYPLVYIPNPFEGFGMTSEMKKEKRVLWLGRMEFEAKRPDRMLNVWKTIGKKYPDWSLDMCGDGDALAELRKYCVRKKLKNVFFYGNVAPEEYLSRASILCMTSSHEGFGMVLLEAMQFGAIPVVMDEALPAKDIISDKKNGHIVHGVKGMKNILSDLLSGKESFSHYTINQDVIRKFGMDSIIDKWEQLFCKILKAEEKQ